MKALWLIFFISSTLKASPYPAGLPGQFAQDRDLIHNIFELERLGLNNYQLPHQPWTSSYLPAIRGYAADPYAGRGSNVLSFSRNFKRAKREMSEFASGELSLSAETIAQLSTADKYDLLIGNFKTDTSLSYRLFEMGDYIKDQFGKLTFWTGMCHGWGPAAISQAAPKRTVFVTSVDGQYRIPFYPNDIKTLLTIAFANNTRAFVDDDRIQTASHPSQWKDKNIMPIVGNACRVKRPKLDRRTGRTSTNCEDVNPGFWHLTMTNMLGRFQQGLVVDIDHNEKVNNHPTAGYEIKYINLDSGKKYRTLRKAVMAIEELDQANKDHRHPRTHALVGVEMNVHFVDYRFFKRSNATTAFMQKIKERKFSYDLELDEQGNILGGEWINETRRRRYANGRTRYELVPGDKPDFVWYAPKGMDAPAYYEEQATGTWDEGSSLPSSWATAAINASYQTNLDYASEPDANGNFPFRPQPEVIFKIAKRLLEFSIH